MHTDRINAHILVTRLFIFFFFFFFFVVVVVVVVVCVCFLLLLLLLFLFCFLYVFCCCFLFVCFFCCCCFLGFFFVVFFNVPVCKEEKKRGKSKFPVLHPSLFLSFSLILTSKYNVMLKIYSLLSVIVENASAYTLITLSRYIVPNTIYLQSRETARLNSEHFVQERRVRPMARRAATTTRLPFINSSWVDNWACSLPHDI